MRIFIPLKYVLIAMIIFLAIGLYAYAGEEEDKIIDYYNIRITYEYLEIRAASLSNEQDKKDNSGKVKKGIPYQSNYQNNIKPILSKWQDVTYYMEAENVLNYEGMSKLLKDNSFDKADTNLSNQINNLKSQNLSKKRLLDDIAIINMMSGSMNKDLPGYANIDLSSNLQQIQHDIKQYYDTKNNNNNPNNREVDMKNNVILSILKNISALEIVIVLLFFAFGLTIGILWKNNPLYKLWSKTGEEEEEEETDGGDPIITNQKMMITKLVNIEKKVENLVDNSNYGDQNLQTIGKTLKEVVTFQIDKSIKETFEQQFVDMVIQDITHNVNVLIKKEIEQHITNYHLQNNNSYNQITSPSNQSNSKAGLVVDEALNRTSEINMANYPIRLYSTSIFSTEVFQDLRQDKNDINNIFEFGLKHPDDNKAVFVVINTQNSISRIRSQSIRSYFNNACDEINNKSIKDINTSIQMMAVGTAIKDSNGKWKVETKAKVMFK